MRWGRLHAGIDIAAPTGTPIRAADGGTVRLAGSVGGYGNYTCIQHTGSLSTCYGHQSSIGVSVGQGVRQGQVIGAVGQHRQLHRRRTCTSRRGSTAAPVDPMGYLLAAPLGSGAVYPEIDLGPLTLQTFGICFALGFLAAGALLARRLTRARQAGRLGLRDHLRRADRRPGRLAGRLPDPELGQGLRRPARQPLLGLRPGLVRRPDRRRARRDPVGVVARLPRRAAVRPRRRPGSRSATRSAGSAASSPATATTARRPTCRGAWPIPREP